MFIGLYLSIANIFFRQTKSKNNILTAGNFLAVPMLVFGLYILYWIVAGLVEIITLFKK